MLANCYTVSEVSCAFQCTGKIIEEDFREDLHCCTFFYCMHACVNNIAAVSQPSVSGPEHRLSPIVINITIHIASKILIVHFSGRVALHDNAISVSARNGIYIK